MDGGQNNASLESPLPNRFSKHVLDVIGANLATDRLLRISSQVDSLTDRFPEDAVNQSHSAKSVDDRAIAS